jgi:transposase InsO family protein
MTPKANFPKLKGQSNYQTWATRAEAFLVSEELISKLSQIIRNVNLNSDEPLEGFKPSIYEAIQPTEEQQLKDRKGLAILMLMVEDGPLLHISKATSLGEAWLKLKSLYDIEGHSAVTTLIKRFISMTCHKSKIHEYLTSIKRVTLDLETNGVKLPDTFIIHWILEKLDKSYDDFKTSIHSNLRQKGNSLNLEEISSQILDESRRRQNQKDNVQPSSSDEEIARVYYTQAKAKAKSKGHNQKTKSYSKSYSNLYQTGPNYCNFCKKMGHVNQNCFKLHPELALKSLSKGGVSKHYKEKDKPSKPRIETREDDILHAVRAMLLQHKSKSPSSTLTKETEDREMAMPILTKDLASLSADLATWNSDTATVVAPVTSSDQMDTTEEVGTSVSSLIEENIFTNSFKDLMEKLQSSTSKSKSLSTDSEFNEFENSTSNQNSFSGNFISDSGATCHILYQRKYFHSFRKFNKAIHWGQASSISIQGVGDTIIKFRDTRKTKILKNCFLVPELGINILSNSKLKNHFACTFPESILLVHLRTGELLTEGKMIKGLYYLPIEIVSPSKTIERAYNIQDLIDTIDSKRSSNRTPIELLQDSSRISSKDNNTSEIQLSLIKENTEIRTRSELNPSLRADIQIQPSQTVREIANIEASSKATELQRPKMAIATQTFHKRMGHINPKALKSLAKSLNIELVSNSFDFDRCEECNEAKMLQQRHKISINTEKNLDYLEKVASDICGPIKPKTTEGYRYFITFLDKSTRFLEIALLKAKDEALQAFSEYKARAENSSVSLKRIRALQTDSGGEYLNREFSDFTKAHGITHNTTAPYTKEPNGLIERVNRTIMEKVRAMLYTGNLPRFLWGHAVIVAVYLYNRTPHSSLEGYITPYEAKTGKKPIVTHLKVFGSLCYYRDNSPKLKLDPRGFKGLVIGFGENANLYKVWDISKRRAVWARDIKVFEGEFLTPYDLPLSLSTKNSDLSQEEDLILSEEDLEKPLQKSNSSDNSTSITRELVAPNDYTYKRLRISKEQFQGTKTTPTRPGGTIEIVLPRRSSRYLSQFKRFEDEELNLVSSVTSYNSMNLDPRISTRWDADEEKILITNLDSEPNSFKEALISPEKDKWLSSMKEEIEELESQGTWNLVDLPPGRVALGGRWVFKAKKNSNGDTVRFKSRWVIQGFSQILGIDYLETFSTTCRPEIYRLVLILAVMLGWIVDQYDVKNAFVHASIDRDIYAIQPTGFNRAPSKVCKILKALYGLKQSPRLWYKYLKEILLKFDFVVFPFDEGVFINLRRRIIICCHVDDLLVAGATQLDCNTLMAEIAKTVKLQYLGPVSTFLGNEIEINRDKKTLFIHQTKYTTSILKKFNKTDLKGADIPFNPSAKLKKSVVQASIREIKQFQMEIGSILYLALKTRPDLCFATIKNSRYSSNPDESHFRSINQLWSYISKYPNLGLLYLCNSEAFIKIYSDSDWGSSLEDRKSTQAFISFIGNCAVNWQTKLQKTVAISSTEAEYMALKSATQEAIYLKNILSWLVDSGLIPLIKRDFATILVDNLGAKELSENPSHHERTKHIDIAYHFTRNCIESGDIKVIHIPDKIQLADPLTKGIPRPKFQWFIENIGLKPWNKEQL